MFVLLQKLSSKTLGFILLFSLIGLTSDFNWVRAENTSAVGTITVAVLPTPTASSSEYFVVSFTGAGELNLTGWKVFDTLSKTTLRYVFSTTTLSDGESFMVCGDSTLQTGCDDQLSTQKGVWNNSSGDTLVLKDENDTEIISVSYTGPASSDTEYENSVAVDYSLTVPATLEITSPASDGEKFDEFITISALHSDPDIVSDIIWSVKKGLCSDTPTSTVAGNIEGFSDKTEFNNGIFTAMIDIHDWTDGEYCFSIDPVETPSADDLVELRTFQVNHPTAVSVPTSTTTTDTEETISDLKESSPTKRHSGSRIMKKKIDKPAGLVLGATTTSKVCGLYLTQYMKSGWDNPKDEVAKLQIFLAMQGYDVQLTEVFDVNTTNAVKNFQVDFSDEILDPWIKIRPAEFISPNGYVYKLTRWKINNIVCAGGEELPAL